MDDFNLDPFDAFEFITMQDLSIPIPDDEEQEENQEDHVVNEEPSCKNSQNVRMKESAQKRIAPGNNNKAPKVPSYVKTIYDLAEKLDDTVMGFDKQGLVLIVRNPEVLCSIIEKNKLLRSGKWPAVVRGLNYHGFKKFRVDEMSPELCHEAGPGAHVFFHAHFQRGRPDLLVHMKGQPKEKDMETTAPQQKMNWVSVSDKQSRAAFAEIERALHNARWEMLQKDKEISELKEEVANLKRSREPENAGSAISSCESISSGSKRIRSTGSSFVVPSLNLPNVSVKSTTSIMEDADVSSFFPMLDDLSNEQKEIQTEISESPTDWASVFDDTLQGMNTVFAA
jgi:hypothetical protein